MKFDSPHAIEQICWSFKLGDYPRSLNRARINALFNGSPPYSDDEVKENNINVNVNFLESTRLAHDARSQFYQAFLKPGNFFTCKTDSGPVHKRQSWSTTVTNEISRVMKRSIPFTECFRSKFALNVLHGISPSGFRNDYCWCPEPMGVEDVMVPANTLLTMYNLPFFAIHKSYTAPELIKLTKGPHRDPAWNMPLVDACIKWIDQQVMGMMGSAWPEVWVPEKWEERRKSDGAFYAYDQAPTIDVWDFYFWNDSKKVSGWNRRMILDAWSSPGGVWPTANNPQRKNDGPYGDKTAFLYDPGDRKWARKREEIINWQFADLSAVAPFKYHSVRSLGFLLFAICHLQNRLRCKFSEAVFEQLMIYFRVSSADDFQRALKVELANRGVVDNNITFIPAAERYEVNAQLAELGLAENARLISQNSSSYSPNQNPSPDRVEKTKFEVMSEVNAMTSLVSAALLQAYIYQNPEYREIFRRFCIKKSPDADVREFQARCLKAGVPENMLCPEKWEIEPERVMGAGNKTLEMAIVQQLLSMLHLFDPDPRRQIIHDAVLGFTDDPARADALVPDKPVSVTDSVHDAQLAAGTLMQGLPVSLKTGQNHIEYVETLLTDMALIINTISTQGNLATVNQLIGLQNMAAHIAQHVEIIAQDENEKQRVKQYGDQLGKLMNLVKGFAQRLQEQMEKQAQSNGNAPDAEAMAKVQSQMMLTQAKIQNTRESHASKTAQRQISWEKAEQQKAQSHAMEMQMEAQRTGLELQRESAKAQLEIEKERKKAASKESTDE